jgi:hypothetical protein
MNKTILVLANSVRKAPKRCIAGREATHNAVSNQWSIGSWVRPVSQQGEGEVSTMESTCTDGTQPAVLDIVTLSVTGNANVPHQPEDYFIDSTVRWVKQARVFPDLSDLAESPTSLWDQPGIKQDRVSDTFLAALTGVRSLYLIRPQNLTFKIWEETNQFEGGQRRKRRAHFDFNGKRYDFSVTDPTMEERYFTPFPALNQPAIVITPREPARCLLVISLSAKFIKDNNHYKLVATVIDY